MPALLTHVRHRLTAGLVAVLAVGVLAACGSASARRTPAVRSPPSATSRTPARSTSLQLADALGYLDGLTLKKVGDVTGGPQSVQALTSHQIDISASCFFGSIAQLVATGAPIKAVVSTYGSSDTISSGIVTLAGSSIKDAQDLVGKKVAVNTLGANAEAVIDTWLKKSGLLGGRDQAGHARAVASAEHGAGAEEAPDRRRRHQQRPDQGDRVDRRQAADPRQRTPTWSARTTGAASRMTDDFLKDNPQTSETLVTGVAKAVRYIESHDRDQVLKIYDAWLKDNGYSDYVEAVDQNWGGSTGVATKKTAGISRQRHLALARLAGRPRRRRPVEDPAERRLHQRLQRPREEGLTDECTDRARRRGPGVPGPRRQGQAASRVRRSRGRRPEHRAGRVPDAGRAVRLRQVDHPRPDQRAGVRRRPATVSIDGRRVTGPGLDRSIVFQQYTLLPWRTAQGNIEFALEAEGGMPKAERAGPAAEYLELVGLDGVRATATRTSSPAA